MGELTGPFGFRGRLGNIVSYRLGDKIVVRTVGSTKATHAHPATQRAKNGFGSLSTANKFFRDTLAPFLADLQRKQLDNDVSPLFHAIRDLDPRPEPERTLSGGLDTAGGTELLTGFEFNTTPGIVRYLLQGKVTATGCSVVLEDFVPRTCIRPSKGASHAVLSSCVARLDFTNATGEISESRAVTVRMDDTRSRRIVLKPALPPQGAGTYLLLLKIAFTEHLNGRSYPLSASKSGCTIVHAFTLK